MKTKDPQHRAFIHNGLILHHLFPFKFLFGKIYLSEANQIKNPNGISTVDAKKGKRAEPLS